METLHFGKVHRPIPRPIARRAGVLRPKSNRLLSHRHPRKPDLVITYTVDKDGNVNRGSNFTYHVEDWQKHFEPLD